MRDTLRGIENRLCCKTWAWPDEKWVTCEEMGGATGWLQLDHGLIATREWRKFPGLKVELHNGEMAAYGDQLNCAT